MKSIYVFSSQNDVPSNCLERLPAYHLTFLYFYYLYTYLFQRRKQEVLYFSCCYTCSYLPFRLSYISTFSINNENFTSVLLCDYHFLYFRQVSVVLLCTFRNLQFSILISLLLHHKFKKILFHIFRPQTWASPLTNLSKVIFSKITQFVIIVFKNFAGSIKYQQIPRY